MIPHFSQNEAQNIIVDHLNLCSKHITSQNEFRSFTGVSVPEDIWAPLYTVVNHSPATYEGGRTLTLTLTRTRTPNPELHSNPNRNLNPNPNPNPKPNHNPNPNPNSNPNPKPHSNPNPNPIPNRD